MLVHNLNCHLVLGNLNSRSGEWSKKVKCVPKKLAYLYRHICHITIIMMNFPFVYIGVIMAGWDSHRAKGISKK